MAWRSSAVEMTRRRAGRIDSRRLSRDVFIMISLAFVVIRLAGVEPWIQAVDAYAYWKTRFAGDPYAGAVAGQLGAYVYPPVFAQLMTPLVWLSWQPFIALWTTILIWAYWYLARDLALPLLLFLPIPFEIVSGNVHLLLALAIVVGFQHAAAWLVPLVTKVSPGVGLLWFALRREWRALGVTFALTGAIVAISFAAAPDLWREWVDVLATSESSGLAGTPGWYLPIPLLVRLPAAVILVAWGALTGRAWSVPVAALLSLPVVWFNSLSMLVAVVALRRPGVRAG